MLPTPPVAPVTITGPLAGVRPFRSRSTIDIAAVKPAVPIAMTSNSAQTLRYRHHPVRRHAHVLRIAAVVRHAEIVAGDQHRIARRNRGSPLDSTVPDDVDAGDQAESGG